MQTDFVIPRAVAVCPHWNMPYVTLLPLEAKVYVWAKDHIRVTESEDELRQKLSDSEVIT